SKWLVEEMRLQWNGREGHYFDQNGILVAFDPAVTREGRNTLLVNKNVFLSFLEHKRCHLVWTLLGGKQIIHGRSQRWAGELQISGTYRFRNRRIEGGVKPIFRDR